MEYIVLVEEPGKDTRALPGSSLSAYDAMQDKVNFQDHPAATKFLIAQVVTEIS